MKSISEMIDAGEPIAYASSKEWRKNHLMSAAQHKSALSKNVVDFDIPLYAHPSPALSVPAAAVVGEPVGYVSAPELVQLKMGASCVDLFREPQPGGIDFAPIYAAPSATERDAVVEPVAYASSKEWRENHLMSAAQYKSALPKNAVDFDIPLYATLPNEALERSEQATFDIAARLLKERDALASRISQQGAELERMRREVETFKSERSYVIGFNAGWEEAEGGENTRAEAAEAKLAEAQTDVDRLRERLQIDPGGGDEIDALESAMEHLRHQSVEARKGAFVEAAAICDQYAIDAEKQAANSASGVAHDAMLMASDFCELLAGEIRAKAEGENRV